MFKKPGDPGQKVQRSKRGVTRTSNFPLSRGCYVFARLGHMYSRNIAES